jgi:glycolate oxidase FAD binding subunit
VNVASAAAGVARELAAIVGQGNVLEDPALLQKFSIDEMAPSVAVAPASPEEVAAILRLASERDCVVLTGGGGTRQSIGGIPERVDILISTSRLHAIEHFDPADLTIGMGAGAIVSQIQDEVARHNLFLPIDVAHPESATIGGSLAVGGNGPLQQGYGGIREFCIGVKFVTGDGKVAKGGGRVVKNVAGYDLMKLMIGSMGTLGVIVSANFKLFPRPRRTRTFVAHFATLEEAARFRNEIADSPLAPTCLELVSPEAEEYLPREAIQSITDKDFRLNAAPPPARTLWRIFLRAAGSEAVLDRYRRELGRQVVSEMDGDVETRLWRSLSNFSDNVLSLNRYSMLLRMSVPPQFIPMSLAAAESAAMENNFLCATIGRLGIGSLVVALVPLLEEPPAVTQYANVISALRSGLPRDGFAVVTRCPSEAKRHLSVWGTTPSDMQTMQVLKQTLDPNGILNRGRFLF